jgi:hypothetical protein
MDETDRGKRKPHFSGDVGYAEIDDHSVSQKKVDDHSSQDVHIDDHSVKTTRVSDNSQQNSHVDDHSHRTRIGDHIGAGAHKTKVNGDKIDAAGAEKVIINKTSSNTPLYALIVLVAIVAIVAVVYLVTGTDRTDKGKPATVQINPPLPPTPPIPTNETPSTGNSNQQADAHDSASNNHSVAAAPIATSKKTGDTNLPPALEFQVGFGMYRILPDGSTEYVREGDTLFSGSGYYFVVRPNAKSYVYLYQIDSNNQVFRLFPNEAYETGQNPISGNQDKMIPNSAMEYFLDESSGTEEIFFFASKAPIEKLENFSTGDRKSLPIEETKDRGVAGIREKDHTHLKSSTKIFQKILEIGSSESEFYHRFSFNHN